MNDVLTEIIKGVTALAVPVLAAVFLQVLHLLKSWIEVKIKNQVIARISQEALDVVLFVAQSIGDDFKEAAKDGKLTEDEKAKLKNIAVDALKRRLSDIPAKLFPDIEKRIEEAIESAIKKEKGNKDNVK